MPAAYRQAAGDGSSTELTILNMVERFGVPAVMGRETLYSFEIRRMMIADQVQNAYRSRRSSRNWVEWAGSNPEAAALLAQAETLAQDTETNG